jgi:helicase
MGGETALLTDEQATSTAIAEEFRKLSSAEPDDVVVIAFSGHGSETHEIVTFDTDPYDVAGTSIPLATIGEWCARIPCRRLLVILDCCFSGGMGRESASGRRARTRSGFGRYRARGGGFEPPTFGL